MNSKLLDNFSYDLIEVLVKYFFDFFPTLFRKLTSNDLNPRIFSIEKTKKCFFFLIFYKNDLKYYFRIEWRFFWGFFWGITHICRSKNEDFRNAAWFSDIFSKNAKSLLKSSNFELQKCNAPQNNPQKNRHKSHV